MPVLRKGCPRFSRPSQITQIRGSHAFILSDGTRIHGERFVCCNKLPDTMTPLAELNPPGGAEEVDGGAAVAEARQKDLPIVLEQPATDATPLQQTSQQTSVPVSGAAHGQRSTTEASAKCSLDSAVQLGMQSAQGTSDSGGNDTLSADQSDGN